VPLCTSQFAVRSTVEQLRQGEANRWVVPWAWVYMMARSGCYWPVTAQERVSRPRPEHLYPLEACLLHPPQLLCYRGGALSRDALPSKSMRALPHASTRPRVPLLADCSKLASALAPRCLCGPKFSKTKTEDPRSSDIELGGLKLLAETYEAVSAR
jgi:hypothetical protein